jgi:pyridoxal phosphate enzyme (YggS family)
LNYVKDNIADVNSTIESICKGIGRNPTEVEVIAVTKTVDTDIINYAIECGAANIGESKVQEITLKYEKIPKKVKWHLIGHLQTNKVKYIIDKVDLIHSVDSISLAEEIDKRAAKAGIKKDILIQVNVAEEDSKFGIKFEDIDIFLEQLSKYKNITIKGFMTIAPYYEDIEQARPVFRKLKEKFDQLSKLQIPQVQMQYLSMGMTNDFTVAIEEGANLVRIGTGIFGERNYNL